MGDSPIQLIQVGLGVMGKGWLHTIAATPELRPVAWVDANPETIRELSEQGLVDATHCYTSFEEAMEREQADAVLVVTPPGLHEAICVQAARAGLHVLCEKPLADTLEAAQRMAAAAREAGTYLMVAQNRRHTPFIHTLRKLVQEGKYGRPGQVFVTFRHYFTRDSFRDQMAHPLLVDMANHHFDTIRCVLGKEPKGVFGTSWNPYWSRFNGAASAVTIFDYEDGLRVVYEGTWHTSLADTTTNGCDWRIECEHGVFVCEDDIVYEARAGSELLPVPMVGMDRQGRDYLLDEFMTSVLDRKAPETTADDNLGTMAMVFAAIEAVDRQKRIELDYLDASKNETKGA